MGLQVKGKRKIICMFTKIDCFLKTDFHMGSEEDLCRVNSSQAATRLRDDKNLYEPTKGGNANSAYLALPYIIIPIFKIQYFNKLDLNRKLLNVLDLESMRVEKVLIVLVANLRSMNMNLAAVAHLLRPPTSVRSERLFSVVSDVNNDHCSKYIACYQIRPKTIKCICTNPAPDWCLQIRLNSAAAGLGKVKSAIALANECLSSNDAVAIAHI
ncbi:hypothetical protein HELRODRAFT_189059 [Helobdella robusta]|uniref:Uncharacterized protein n=1 Tax=Helobdella robusta TaxID=6412 RepID=T1FQL7_HELRO|nr:hypothetical protein HELRODRAFT_189059 [Helobdella robusta]ESN99394.1 hypothetical protein HELRODRAFT_189059 [Helobdella robusta]